MHAIFGTVASDLANVPAGAIQFSPLYPGCSALDEHADGSLASITMLAPGGVIERRYSIAHALRSLRPDAPFTFLAPNKRGGTRLYDELLAFGCPSDDASRYHHRICRGLRPNVVSGLDEAMSAGAPRFIDSLGLWSQPGIFSWDRIDPGSALLIEYLPSLSGRGADLGCGFGVLARAVLAQSSVQHMTLIDIDRRAVVAARRNIDAAHSTALWDDATTSKALPSGLDFVIMNPPFHDGGIEDQNLGRAFIKKSVDMLRTGGMCFLTANRHLPYEAAMIPLFSKITQVVQANGFKIYVAQK